MRQTNMHNTNQQPTKQQRVSPQRNQKENNQTTIIVSDTQRDDTTSEDQYFLFQGHNRTDWKEKSLPPK